MTVGHAASVRSVPDETLSGAEVECMLAQRIPARQSDLRAAFQTLDTEGNFTVTTGEFRRVIEGFLLPLSQPQFDALLTKVPKRGNGSVAYMEFLRKYCRASTAVSRCCTRSRQRPMMLGEMQCCLKDKIANNLKNITRAFRLFDHNQDGRIQRHELRRILDCYCVPLSDQEFHRLWSHYSPNKAGTISYRVFLEKLGVDCENYRKLGCQESVKSVLNWEAVNQDNKRRQEEAWTPADRALPSRELTLDQIQIAFLKKMRMHYGDVWRGLQAFDVTRSGFVSQEDLKSVLSNFLFPMSDTTFQGLFRDLAQKDEQMPKARGDPVQGSSSEQPGSGMVQQKQPDVDEVFPLLKRAFLMLDAGEDGKVTRAEFRRVMEGPAFRLTDRQLKELMILLDPEHAGIIQCQRILEILQPQEGTPVEGLLRDKLCEHLTLVMEELACYDHGQNGTVHQEELRKVIQSYGLPLSDSHFHRLCEPCMDSGRVVYSQFLKRLGVSRGSNEAENTGKAPGLAERSRSSHPSHVESIRSRAVQDTVLKKLRDSLSLQNTSLQDLLLKTGRDSGGMLSLKHFKRILEDRGIILDPQEFHILAKALGFKDGSLSHSDLLGKYEENVRGQRSAYRQRSGSDRSNGGGLGLMTAEDCLSQLKGRIKERHGDILSAFLVMDKNHDGLVSRNDFRGLYNSLLFVAKETEYQRLLELLGLKPGATLNYSDFFNMIQSINKIGAQPHPANRTMQSVSQASDQVHGHLVTRARSGWSEMAKTFSQIDEDGQGLVYKKDLRQLLYTYALPITPNEFEKLWSRYDVEGKGYLTHSEFLRKLGVDPEGERRGLSHVIEEEQSELQRQADTVGMETPHTRAMLRDVGEVIRGNYQDFSVTLTRLDEKRDGRVTVKDLQALLQKHSCLLEEGHLIQLLNNLNITVENGKLPYLDFLRAFDKQAVPATPDPPVQQESVEGLSTERALLRIREVVALSFNTLHKAFSAFDKSGKGTVPALEFRRVLDHFCVRLSDRQLRHLLAKLRVNEEDHTIPWREFLLRFHPDNQETTEEWLEKVRRAGQPAKSRPLPIEDVLGRIQEVVSAKLYTITKEMADLDYAHINVISKEDFRSICDHHFMRLTLEQFENLWNQLPVNAFGNLEYREFLKRFSGVTGEKPPSPERGCPSKGSPSPSRSEVAPSVLRRPKTAPCTIGHSQSAEQKEQTGRPSTAGGRATPLQNGEVAERRLRSQMQSCWRVVQRRCRDQDTEGAGHISVDSFLAIMGDLHVKMTQPELEQLAAKHDIKINGTLSYPDFLRQFVLSLKPQATPAFHRPKVPLPRRPMSAGVLSGQCLAAMLRIHGLVQRFWRPMRQSFITFDRTRSGHISLGDFRQVLGQYSINLSEDEVFHLSSYFDKNLSGKISYNDFLHTFLT
ncbi:EF-hand calcium-binding domain-containing protein 6 [Megalops cyprinoides]|uniref:EF-hand calcium-binding domain-containing protein 6 n=1 Tax=Megalops cyprinoides TaxID=118141 RepID=UPI00186435D9|nr:EF-hand calcium-binding domain-containing protein 6 [Megalops cyprinoides]